ncbi:Cholesterol 7-alpha-monooxygenase [Beauveria bassiana]|nr:Cholesterol 7-alpha-monooxygenase [Beauveria bassiana]
MFGLPSLDVSIFRSDFKGFGHAFRHYLLKTEATSELVIVYLQRLREQLLRHDDQRDIQLGSWVHHDNFNASVDTIFGVRLLQIYPELEQDLFIFKKNTMSLLAGLPRLLFPAGYRIRNKIVLKFQEFHQLTLGSRISDIPDPDAIGWQPSVGSRMWRALHMWYAKSKMTSLGAACLDVGILIAATSNSIPVCIWMLMHILDTNSNKGLLQNILNELAPIRLDDGRINARSLAELPILQSVYLEVLRLYTDGLLIRRIDKSSKIAVDSKTSLVLSPGIVAASTWLSHHSPHSFANPPADVFFAERFVTVDAQSGKRLFKSGDLAGRLFPYSGGESMCPGRNFAKQEILGTVAMILTAFDLQFIEYLDSKGNASNTFPSTVAYHLSAGVMVPDGDMRVKVTRRGA